MNENLGPKKRKRIGPAGDPAIINITNITLGQDSSRLLLQAASANQMTSRDLGSLPTAQTEPEEPNLLLGYVYDMEKK
jgi:hypothetical protein